MGIFSMNWILLSIIVAFLYAVIHIVDKIFIDNHVKNPYLASAISFFSTLVIFCSISFFKTDVFSANFKVIAISFTAGIINSICVILYYYTLQKEEVSRFIPIMSLQPGFAVILAYFILAESFSSIVYLGIILILFGSLLMSIRKKINKFGINKLLLFLLIIVTILFALKNVLIKLGSLDTDIYIVNFWVGVAAGLMFIIFIFKNWPKNKLEMKGSRLLLIADILSAGTFFALALTLKKGPASLVTSIMQLKLVFVFIFSVFFTIFFPKILKEEISKKILLQKIIAMSIIIIGTILIIYR